MNWIPVLMKRIAHSITPSLLRHYLHTLRQQGAKQKLDEIYDTFNVVWDKGDFQPEENMVRKYDHRVWFLELLELKLMIYWMWNLILKTCPK